MKGFVNKAINKSLVLTIELLSKQKLKSTGVEFAEGLRLYGAPIISMSKGSRISLGRRVVLCSWSGYTALGVNHAVVLRTLVPGAELIIGDDVGISGGAICAAERVSIGSNTMLGANVTIVDTDFHPISSENRRYSSGSGQVGVSEVSVGENVFIGTNSTVLKGVRIGDNSVIGAGSVVTSDIPANVVAAGNPCRPLRDIPVGVARPYR